MRIAIGLACIAAVACARTNLLRVEPADAGPPSFVISDTTGRVSGGIVYGLSVLRCGTDSVAWTIAATGSSPSPQRVVYGVAPPGFAVREGPAPLRPGCYQVYVSGAGGVRFSVQDDGRVTVPR